MSWIRVAVLAATLAAISMMIACPPQNTPQMMPPAPDRTGSGYAPPTATDGGVPDASPASEQLAAAGAACTLDAECESSVCEGQGCGEGEGKCAARDARCTRDLRPYCGCDGVTFSSSGSCPGARYQFPGECEARPEGQSCLDGAECASGVCEGQGCGDDAPGTCAPKGRACTKDLRPYCGCDGKTFKTSGSCPGRRYAAKGSCQT